MKLFEEHKYTKYYITKDGRVISKTTYNGERTQEKKQTLNKKRGYYYVRTTLGNYQVHRLVAEAYLPNPKNKPCINHIDGNKTNNSVSNLEWATHKENTQHGIEKGLLHPLRKNQGAVKYPNEVCLSVLELIERGYTYRKAGEMFNMPYSTVAHLVRGSRRSL